MRILGIETSCDETSIAVVEDGRKVLSCIIASSQKDFERTGGVIPEDAARKQLESILPVLEKALLESHADAEYIDAIAVTYCPGLLGSLLVGTTTARTLSALWKKPIIPVHHTLGHLSSTWLISDSSPTLTLPPNPPFPILTLSVSGGHTDLWYRTSHTSGTLIGTTLDDAAGEAFDKGAVMLGLSYPGGPELAKLASSGDESMHTFPMPLRKEHGCDFSFSGLKTSLKYYLRDAGKRGEEMSARESIAASYQLAICKHLCDSLSRACDLHPETKEIHIVGGVSANERLRTMAESVGQTFGLRVRWPSSLRYCTDNAAMIASAGYFLVQEKPEMLGAAFKTSATVSLVALLESTDCRQKCPKKYCNYSCDCHKTDE